LREYLDVLGMIEAREVEGIMRRENHLGDHRNRDLKVKETTPKQVDTSLL
jgi:hypothetical protein